MLLKYEPHCNLLVSMNQLVNKGHGGGPSPHHQVVAAKLRHHDSLLLGTVAWARHYLASSPCTAVQSGCTCVHRELKSVHQEGWIEALGAHETARCT